MGMNLPPNIEKAMCRTPVFAPYAPPAKPVAAVEVPNPNDDIEPENAFVGLEKLTPNANNPDPKISDTKPSQQTGALVSNDAREAPRTGCPSVRFTLHRVRLLDVDAKWGSVKDLLDGLAIAGLIPGDREDQITLDVRQEKVASFKEEKTVIEITTP